MCSECRQTPCHPQCPNAPLPHPHSTCLLCKEGIYSGEEYIINDNRFHAHWECFDGTMDLLNFLGYEIKTMKGENDEY